MSWKCLLLRLVLEVTCLPQKRNTDSEIVKPYAPFGGCYDDWVVLSVAAEILKQGFVVGTFNFR